MTVDIFEYNGRYANIQYGVSTTDIMCIVCVLHVSRGFWDIVVLAPMGCYNTLGVVYLLRR